MSAAVPVWRQSRHTLTPRKRGVHIVHDELLAAAPPFADLGVGLLHVFLMHTSASLALTENADPDVRGDLERHLSVLAPEGAPAIEHAATDRNHWAVASSRRDSDGAHRGPLEAHYQHNDEGPDDMPAHIKNVLLGASLTLPIGAGRLLLGTWQGICLCEHRNRAGSRQLVLTVQGSIDS